MSLNNRRISILNRIMSRRHVSVFGDPDVAAELAEPHQQFVGVLADKASNNIVLDCITHYINCLMLYNDRQPDIQSRKRFCKTTIRLCYSSEFLSQKLILIFLCCIGFQTKQESLQSDIHCWLSYVLNQTSFSDSNKNPYRS